MHHVQALAGCSPKWHIEGSSSRQVWPRQLCLCLSEAAGGNSTAAQGEHPMRHVQIWSLRLGERPKDKEREREKRRWVREWEGIIVGVTDTEGERGSLHPVGFEVSKLQVQFSVMWYECLRCCGQIWTQGEPKIELKGLSLKELWKVWGQTCILKSQTKP